MLRKTIFMFGLSTSHMKITSFTEKTNSICLVCLSKIYQCIKTIVIVSGDFNSRIGTSPDFIENDLMGTDVNNFISNDIDYNCDIPMSTRESQDLVVNSFERKLLDLCRSTFTRVCNGRIIW